MIIVIVEYTYLYLIKGLHHTIPGLVNESITMIRSTVNALYDLL